MLPGRRCHAPIDIPRTPHESATRGDADASADFCHEPILFSSFRPGAFRISLISDFRRSNRLPAFIISPCAHAQKLRLATSQAFLRSHFGTMPSRRRSPRLRRRRSSGRRRSPPPPDIITTPRRRQQMPAATESAPHQHAAPAHADGLSMATFG